MTNIFISWGGEQSRAIAEELRNWIPSVLQFAKPYYTPSDIEKGSNWSGEISKKLSDCNVGIICLTKDNTQRPWVIFEAGALSKDMEKSRVCSVLFGIDDTDLSGPLTTFQATKFNKPDFKKMMLTINEAGGANGLSRDTFDRVFDMWWPQLEAKITDILGRDLPKHDASIRSDRELIEEILTMTRSMNRSKSRDGDQSELHPHLTKDLVSHIEKIMDANRTSLSDPINDSVGTLLKMAKYLAHSIQRGDPDLIARIDAALEMQSAFISF